MIVGQLMASEDFLVAEIDRAGLVKDANESFSRARGVALGELIGAGLPYLVNAEERDGFVARVRLAFDGGVGGEVVARLLTASGDAMPRIRWGLLPLPGPDGAIDGCVCVGIDLAGSLRDLPPGPEAGETGQERNRVRQALARAEEERNAARQALEDAGREIRGLKRQLKEARASRPAAPPPPVPVDLFGEQEESLTLREIERRHIFHTLRKCKGRVSGPRGAAAVLGIHPNTLRSRMEKLELGKVP